MCDTYVAFTISLMMRFFLWVFSILFPVCDFRNGCISVHHVHHCWFKTTKETRKKKEVKIRLWMRTGKTNRVISQC